MMKIQIIGIVFLIILFMGCIEQIDNQAEQDGSSEQEDKVNETINHLPKASFTYINDKYTVMFYDSSTDIDNDTLAYIWDFGDGFNSIEHNPVHTYDCSETNVFDITLTVNDSKSEDTHTEHILFGSHLNIVSCYQTWIRNYSEVYTDPVWNGEVTMTIENTGNIPAYISYAKITQHGFTESDLSGSIYFNFTYTYDELVEGGNGNGFESEIWLTFISNNTLTLNPDKSITLTSNPELTRFTYVGDEPFTPGSYHMNIWLHERIRGEDRSYTLYETTIELY